MNYNAVIFDLDGTLVNSLDDLADSMNQVLRQYNFPIHENDAYKQFVGNGIRMLVGRALPQTHKDDKTISGCFNQMMDVYRTNCINKTKPYTGIIELLDQLVARKIKLAVLSNKADEFTRKIVLQLFPGYFEVITGFTTEVSKKPNPAVALQIGQYLGTNPENIIFMGDSGVDMQTANNAGMYAVGALWGFRYGEELSANGAKLLLNQPLDLLAVL
jgi:phosphoglycolate phosphatase